MPRKTKKQLQEENDRWDREAHSFVVHSILDVAHSRMDTRSEIGRRAHDRMVALANAIDPREVSKWYAERSRMVAGFAAIMADIFGNAQLSKAAEAGLGPHHEQLYCGKHYKQKNTAKKARKKTN